MTTTTSVFAPLVKIDKNDDGTLTVHGKATGPDLDSDKQICDPGWLTKAVPEWFKTGANVREMHAPRAAGVGKALEQDGESWNLTSLVVDPVSCQKVDAKVLKGYSIGIANARVIKDVAAPGGRIVGGDIVEISLVDRPANPTCTLALAKMAGADEVLVSADIAKDDSTGDGAGGEGDGAGDDDVSRVASIRQLLTDWLASEAAEAAEGGSIAVVHYIGWLIQDLDFLIEVDAMDDAEQAMAIVNARINPTEEVEIVIELATVASLVKSAKADDATDQDREQLGELRKALGLDALDALAESIKTAVTEATTEASKPFEERIESLEGELAKVAAGPAPDGPSLVTHADSAEMAKAAFYRQEAKRLEVVNPSLAQGYRELAAQHEQVPAPT